MDRLKKHLIIVPGHAAFETDVMPDELPDRPFDVGSEPWVLASYQYGEPTFFGEHMRAGLDVAADDPNSLLVVSGGFTRPDSVNGRYDWSEADSYIRSAERSGWIRTLARASQERFTPRGSRVVIPTRAVETTDGKKLFLASNEYARDSIENVLGDIATFKALTGSLPRFITVTGWKFKDERFREHAEAIGVPIGRFDYVGVNDPSDDNLALAQAGERRTIAAFRADPLGRELEGMVDDVRYPGSLAEKRQLRDPLARGNPHWDMAHDIHGRFECRAN